MKKNLMWRCMSPSIRKTLLVMKLSFILILVGSLQLSASVLLGQQVSVQAKTSLVDVLEDLNNQTGTYFMYNVHEIDDEIEVQLDMENASLEEVLNEICKQAPVKYEIVEDFVIITKKDPVPVVKEVQEKKELKGKVTDKDGIPLPGVSVVIKGTSTGVATDIDGNYTLEMEDKNAVLIFSFVGMLPKEIAYNGQPEMNVSLIADTEQMEEVVVTGFQTISKERSAGSYSILNEEEFNLKHMPDVTTVLEGKVAGMNTYGGEIVIRGRGTFQAGSQPLIVVDGLPIEGGLASVNSNDIKTMTVLKDAAAASIYGARAANGVIVITTKEGVKDKFSVQASVNYKYQLKPEYDYYNFASTSDVIDYELDYMNKEFEKHGGDVLAYFSEKNAQHEPYSKLFNMSRLKAQGKLTQADYNTQLEQLRKNDYRKEYIDEVYRNTLSKDYNLFLSNATDKSNTTLSFKYVDNEKMTINSEDKSYNLHLKNTFKPMSGFKFSVGANMNLEKSKTPKGIKGMGDNMPYERIKDDKGKRAPYYHFNYAWMESIEAYPDLQDLGYNVLDESERNFEKRTNTKIRAFLDANIKLMDGLEWNAKLQYEHFNYSTGRYSERESYEMRDLINKYVALDTDGKLKYYVPNNGRKYSYDGKSENFIIRNQLSFNKTFNEDHHLTALIGNQVRETSLKTNSNTVYGYDNQTLSSRYMDWEALRNGVITLYYKESLYKSPLTPNVIFFENKNRYVSFYSNFAYSYQNRFNVTGSIRVDQSNLFGTDPKYKYRPLWSIGAGWNLHNEEFMANSLINRLKVRASYGVGGNIDRSTSPYVIINTYASGRFHDNLVAYLTQAPNPLLRWEKTDTYNFGVDLTMFNNRLNTTIDAYYRYSSDLLARKNYDPATGFASGVVNNGEMSNRGLELTLSYDWLKSEQFKWNTSLVVAWNKNKIEKVNFKVADGSDLIENPHSYYLEGQAYKSIYAYKYAGLTETGDPSVYNENGEVISGTPMRNPDGLVIKGQLDPKITGSIENRISYKNFELSALLIYNLGHKLRNEVTTLYESLYSGIGSSYLHKDLANRWTETNTNTTIPRMGLGRYNTDRMDQWKYADAHVKDASYIKLRNVALRYALPTNLANKINAESVHFRLQANNLFYWCAAGNHIDPETYNANLGIRLPQQRASFVVGLDVKF